MPFAYRPFAVLSSNPHVTNSENLRWAVESAQPIALGGGHSTGGRRKGGGLVLGGERVLTLRTGLGVRGQCGFPAQKIMAVLEALLKAADDRSFLEAADGEYGGVPY